MKIRLQHVANSSSSSFVLCGYKTTDPAVQNMLKDVDDVWEWAEEYDLDYWSDDDLIGRRIVTCYDSGVKEISLVMLQNGLEETRKYFADLGVTAYPKIYLGVSVDS